MHSYKIAGLVLLLGSGALASLMLSRFEQRRYRQAEGFLALLRHIRLQIDCFSLPVSRILETLPEQISEGAALPTDAQDFDALLDGTTLLLTPPMCELLIAFGADLGTSYREDQLRCCDYYITRFAPLCERMREELPRRMRLALLLPLALALSLALLLI